MHLFLGNFVSDHYTIDMMKKHMLKFYHVENENLKLRQDMNKSYQKFFENPKKLLQIKNEYIFRVIYLNPKGKEINLKSREK
jgi:hypothetical protein